MNSNSYFILTAAVFSLIALGHLSRITMGWEAMIGGWAVPMWASWIVVLIALVLAYSGLMQGKK